MPLETNRAAIRSRLNVDRIWSVYALGDLAPGLFEHTTWHVELQGGALLMIYAGLGTPVLFAIGDAENVDLLLDELAGQHPLYLLIKPEILPVIHNRYRVMDETPMWRMVLDPAR